MKMKMFAQSQESLQWNMILIPMVIMARADSWCSLRVFDALVSFLFGLSRRVRRKPSTSAPVEALDGCWGWQGGPMVGTARVRAGGPPCSVCVCMYIYIYMFSCEFGGGFSCVCGSL